MKINWSPNPCKTWCIFKNLHQLLQINEENEQFKEGKSSYYEKLNVHSDVPKEMFEKQFEGAKLPDNGRGMGAILPSEDEWYTHPDLEALYNSRQTPPASYDATALGMKVPISNFQS